MKGIFDRVLHKQFREIDTLTERIFDKLLSTSSFMLVPVYINVERGRTFQFFFFFYFSSFSFLQFNNSFCELFVTYSINS